MMVGVVVSLSGVRARLDDNDFNGLLEQYSLYKDNGWEIVKGCYIRWSWKRLRCVYSCEIMKLWE